MTLPETISFQVDKLVGDYCQKKVPAHARAQIVVTYEIRGSAVTVFENRPPWRDDTGPKWTKIKIAQMRWDRDSKLWAMWWTDRNGKWLPYPDFKPSADLQDCLWQLDNDKSGAFWG